MAEHVTRCPHCHTSFRIRSEHLAAAKGKVRCGSCLQVFNARENLVNTSTAPKDTVLKEASNTPAVHHQTHLQATPSERLASVEEDPQEHVAPPQVDTASGDDDLSNHEEVPADELFDSFFDDPEPTTTETSRASHPKSLDIGASEPREESLEELFGLAPKQEPASKKESLLSDDPFADFNEIIARGSSGSDSGDIEIDESLLDFGQQTKSTATEKTEDSDDEDWARALLEDDDEVELDLSEDPVPEEFTGTNTRQDRSQGKKQAEQDLYAIQNLKPGSETTAISKSQPARSTTQEFEKTKDNARRKPAPGLAFRLAEDDLDDSENNSAPVEQNNHSGEGILGQNFDLATPARASGTKVKELDFTQDIEADPINLTAGTSQKKQKHASIWLFGSIGLLLLVVLQIAIFEFHSLARDPGFRPLYANICSLTGCQLPSRQDVSQMAARNLIVRSHPKVPAALSVDALLINHADYNQPFPDLQLIFKDINGDLIGSRRLQPSEYLAGEMTGAEIMPSGIPVHIGLELLAPQKTAISHELKLITNDR